MGILHGAVDKHAGGETLKAIIDLDKEVRRLRGMVNNLSQKSLITQSTGASSIGEGFALPNPIPQEASLFLLKTGKSLESKLCYAAPGSDNIWRWYEVVATG